MTNPVDQILMGLDVLEYCPVDTIVSYGSSLPMNIDKIRALNFTVVYADCYRLDNLNRDAYVFGELTGNQEGAQKYIRFNQKYRTFVDSRLANITPDEPPTVYGTLSLKGQDQYVFTRDGLVDDLINSLHALNANGDMSVIFPRMSPEGILQKDPDIVFILGYWGQGNLTYEPGTDSLCSVAEKFQNDPEYKELKTVQSNRIYI